MTILEIKAYMKRQKITYQDLSDQSGIPLNTLKNIFSGSTKHPRIDTMQAIAQALGIQEKWTVDDFAQGVSLKRKIEITPEEDDLLYLYQRIGEKLGKAGQETFKEIGEVFLQMKRGS